jgi:hypothetical protein
MYPVRIVFKDVLGRIDALRNNGHNAEALVTSVFTLEKLMRRCMRMAILARGFTTAQTNHLLHRKGFDNLKQMWDVFDKDHKKLPEIVGQRIWQHVPSAVEKRNQLVHGLKTFKLSECDASAAQVISALQALHADVLNRYGGDPWAKLKGRKTPKLQWLL